MDWTHRTSHLQALLLVVFCGVGTTACAGMDDLVPVEVALPTASWSEAEPPMGKFCGRVYDVPLETRRLPNFAALQPTEALCTDRLAVSVRNNGAQFPGVRGRVEWFGVDFQGVITVAAPGQYSFRLTSDDGSKLILDGVQVLDNDGYHPVRTVESTVELTAGPHRFSVPYWQGPGPMALLLEAARPGESYEVLHADRPL